VKVAANSELETRPYGPKGMLSTYGVNIEIDPVEDTGGALTVKALTDGTVEAANIPTASTTLVDNDLVLLDDPKNLILPEHVTPLVRKSLPIGAAQALDAVSARLTAEELRALNARSTKEQLESAAIASDWLAK
jgi:ABC transporter glycine betaine